MPIVVYNGESFSCTKAVKGTDYIKLYNNDVLAVSFHGIVDFSKFTINDGAWSAPDGAEEVRATATLSGGALNITAGTELGDNTIIKFKAPCACSSVTSGVKIDGVNYSIVDATGNVMTGPTGGAWGSNALVSLQLDTTDKKAYILNSAVGDAYTKAQTLKPSTSQLFGLSAEAVPDEVFADVFGRFNAMKLRPANNVELGPDDTDERNFVCDSNSEAYVIYARLMGAKTPWVTKGRYSYAYEHKRKYVTNSTKLESGLYAYRLDHMTKQAELLCDLASYAGTVKADEDKIIAIDDQYIYMGRNDRYDTSDDEFNVTFMKFDHSGNLVLSKSYVYDGTQNVRWDYKEGFSGGSSYYSILYGGSEQTFFQTKNYIVIQNTSPTASSSSFDRYHHFRVISKNTFDVAYNIPKKYDFGTRLAIYDHDLFFILGYGARAGNDGAVTNYLYDMKKSAQIGESGSLNRYYLQTTLGSVTRYLAGVEGCIYNVGHKNYYLLRFCSDTRNRENICYAVVSDNDFNLTTLAPSVNYFVTDSAPAFGTENYDPVDDEFHCMGVEYEVYPTYIAPYRPGTLNELFTETPFFKVGGYYYFLRNKDGMIYRLEDKQYYVIDRVEVRE